MSGQTSDLVSIEELDADAIRYVQISTQIEDLVIARNAIARRLSEHVTGRVEMPCGVVVNVTPQRVLDEELARTLLKAETLVLCYTTYLDEKRVRAVLPTHLWEQVSTPSAPKVVVE